MAIGDHPNWNTLNTWTESLIKTIEAQQARHFARRKCFFQGLKTPTDQCDGIASKDIAYGLKPEDQAESWADFAPQAFKAGVQFPASVKIDVYEHPAGWGYITKFDLYLAGLGPDAYGNDGEHWVYQTNHGPGEIAGIWDEWHIISDGD